MGVVTLDATIGGDGEQYLLHCPAGAAVSRGARARRRLDEGSQPSLNRDFEQEGPTHGSAQPEQ